VLFISLRSGSYGNGYIISDGTNSAMFDAGVPKSLVKWALDLHKIPPPTHIFISHEHHDHVRTLGRIANFLDDKIVVVGTQKTLSRTRTFDLQVYPLESNVKFAVGDLIVTLIPKPHDAVEPVGFVIEGQGEKIAIMSDLGFPDECVVESMMNCNVILLESNYDHDMLMTGNYPQHLKVRIAGNRGHLSNEQCVSILARILDGSLQKVALGHLSEENNTPQKAFECAKNFLPSDVKLVVASRYEPMVISY
jgi:phosphoribosyl 1,2-cyclic phosphodiesterase